MTPFLDRISNPYTEYNDSRRRIEGVADTLLAPLRAWGLARSFTVIHIDGNYRLDQEREQGVLVLRIASIVLLPLAAVAVFFGSLVKLVLHLSAPQMPRQVIASAAGREVSSAETSPLKYPAAKRLDHKDTYHGTQVSDPYRWLEDAGSLERVAWMKEQTQLTNQYLDAIPERKDFEKRLKELWNYPKYGLPHKTGEHFFWLKNDGLQNQSVLYTAKSYSDEGRVLLDPNTLAADGTTSLSSSEVSNDGKYLAYAFSVGGSDWNDIKIKDIATGIDLEDSLQWVKFSGISWTKDSRGFFYSRYDQPSLGQELQASNQHHKLYYHEIGASQNNDRLIYERIDKPDWLFGGGVTEDGHYLVIRIEDGCQDENGILIKDLIKEAPVLELFTKFDAHYACIGSLGSAFWFETTLQADNKRIVKIDLEDNLLEEIVPEQEDLLSAASIIGGHLVLEYLQDAHSVVKIHRLDGSYVRDLDLPGIGTVSGFHGKQKDPETFFSFSGFTTPPSTYRYDVLTGETEKIRRAQVAFNCEDFTTRQIFFESKDGTKVPMFISHKKTLRQDGENRVLLYGYGGFNINLTPSFSIANVVWMEKGGIYCQVNLRGGGEYGKHWHEEGMKLKKQNVFDDFQAAARYLITEKYTKPAKLAIMGGSNGGLLVGACLNQTPELFGAAIPHVGVMDMLRFNQFTIGKAWESDYGSPQNEEEFNALRAYSPYHNIDAEKKYPAVMVMTSDHDDRVVPLHSFKYAAHLQWAKKEPGDQPALIRIAAKTGHGAGRSTADKIKELADQWAFLEKHLH